MRCLGYIAAVLLLVGCSSGNMVEDSFKNMRESRELIEIKSDNILEFHAELATNKRSFIPFYNKGKDIKKRYDKIDFDTLLTQAELIKKNKQSFEEITSYIPDEYADRLSFLSYDKTTSISLLRELIKSDLAILTKDCLMYTVASISYCGPRFWGYSPWNISYETDTDTTIIFNDYRYMAFNKSILVFKKGSELIEDYTIIGKENTTRDSSRLKIDNKIIGFPYNKNHIVTLRFKSTKDTGYDEWIIDPSSLLFKQ